MSFALASLALAVISVSSQEPNSAEFAEALHVFTGKSISVDDIRGLSCDPIGEDEPTEAACKWQQRRGSTWKYFSTYVALSRGGWQLIDEPQAVAPPSVPPQDAAAEFVRRTLNVSSYKRADADLNGDGREETLVYVTDPSYCGSGGCTLLIVSPVRRGYRVVLRSTVTRLPIRLLLTATHGWRDIGVTVGGGSILRPYVARLRFNGRGYPSNPTAPPALPLKRPSGRILIGG